MSDVSGVTPPTPPGQWNPDGDQGISHHGCNYLCHGGMVCNKCGAYIPRKAERHEPTTLRSHLDEMKASMRWAICHDAPFSPNEIRRLEAHVEGMLAILDNSDYLASVEGVRGGEEGTHRLVRDSGETTPPN